jgi:holliday junction DNA helicase RuvA
VRGAVASGDGSRVPMIGSVRGRILSKSPPQLLVEVGGLGYELEAPMSTFFHLPAVGEEVRLLTHLVVREDAHVLYGFATEEERRLFRSLIKIAGVGPKIALALLSGLSVEAFALCVQSQDVAALIKVPGIGRKTAERLLIEMRDRLEASGRAVASAVPAGASPEAEAFGALIALGYKPAEATRLLKAAGPGTHSTEELIRRALRGAAPE